MGYIMCCKWLPFYVWQASPQVKPNSLEEQYLRTFIKKPAGGGADSPLRRYLRAKRQVDPAAVARHGRMALRTP
jgi:hypothetical protein